MSTSTHENTTTHQGTRGNVTPHQGTREIDTREQGTETRRASKTTELMAYVTAVLAVIVTAFVVGDDGANTADPFSAEHALRYVTFLTIGYMVARGLAKSGTRGNARDDH